MKKGIDILDLKFSYPDSDFYLAIPELKVEPGQKLALIGPSGFGKTTLLNLISGILQSQNTRFEVMGIDLNKLSDKERRSFRIKKVGFVFQDFRLIEYLTVQENILLPFRINSWVQYSPEALEKSLNLSKELGIEGLLKKYPAKLSHGEKQRTAICRALINDPDLILADEPTGNLDPKNKARIKELLFRLSDSNGSTLLTVTHDHELLSGFDRVIDFSDYQKAGNEG